MLGSWYCAMLYITAIQCYHPSSQIEEFDMFDMLGKIAYLFIIKS